MTKFFSDNFDCKDKAEYLYIGVLLLVIDAFIDFVVLFFLLIALWWVGLFYWINSRKQEEEKSQKLKIKDLLLNTASLRLNPTQYEVGDDWPICCDTFQNDQNIISLPWNKGHIFHDYWIAEWIQHNNTWPMCKAPVTEEAIELATRSANNSPRPTRNSNNEIYRQYFAVRREDEQT